MTFLWSEESVATAKRLWLEGKSGTEIAREIGATRSAVLGKLLRAGLLTGKRQQRTTGKPARAPTDEIAATRSRTADSQAGALIKRRLEAPAPRPSSDSRPLRPDAWKPLPGTTPVHRDDPNSLVGCQWPLFDPMTHFCGLPKAVGSYCEAHAARAEGTGTNAEREAVRKARKIARLEAAT